jgi:hypothetical protein
MEGLAVVGYQQSVSHHVRGRVVQSVAVDVVLDGLAVVQGDGCDRTTQLYLVRKEENGAVAASDSRAGEKRSLRG